MPPASAGAAVVSLRERLRLLPRDAFEGIRVPWRTWEGPDPDSLVASAGFTLPLSSEFLADTGQWLILTRPDGSKATWRRWPSFTDLINRALDQAFDRMLETWKEPVRFEVPESRNAATTQMSS